MAERIKDAEDRLLESMFESTPIADDGFSVAVVRRVNRKLWVRRLALPVAAALGGLIAFKPLAGLVTLLANLLVLVPEETFAVASGAMPQLQTVLLGAVLVGVGLLGLRIAED